jgi:polynucleotide 5'-hydroxyl-kinase GRC3/NOL9
LSIVSKPIMSDPPMHMICSGQGCKDRDERNATDENCVIEQVIASYFFGDITSKADPDTYIHIANKLMYKYQEFIASRGQEYSQTPLIVNTDGWVKGLGYEILSAIIGISNPAHIVQILGNTKAKSFDLTSFHSVDDDNSCSRCVHTIQSFDDYSNPALAYDNNKLGSLDSQSVLTGPLLATAADHRSHRICAYFLGGCNKMSALSSGKAGDDTPIQFHKEKGLVDPSSIIGLTLASMLPYAVPFHAVRLYPPSGLLDSVTEVSPMWGIRADLASSDVLDSLSGLMVGLCCEPDASDYSNIGSCNVGSGVPILPCAGLGIIRSIDQARRIFYVLTPVHPQLLSSVTSFVGGSIALPLECVYRGIYSDSFPYLSFGQAVANHGLGSEVMKSRNHSGRKK